MVFTGIQRIQKVWWQRSLLISVGLWLILTGLSRCVQIRMSDKKVEKYFAGSPQQPTFHTIETDEQPIHYAEIGADTLPMVVFVHGSPGSWDAFISFFKDSTLYRKARLVSVDRPGFGKSDLGYAEPSLSVQAAAIAPVLQTNKSAKLPILIGHSLGGPVIARMAMDFPELVGSLIMVAPSIDPAMEKWEWYRHLGNFALVRPMLPVEMDVSNQEILPLKAELTQMLPLWKNIRVPVTVIQGDKDNLVPAENADFARRQLVHALVDVQMIPDMNHFIPWSRPESIRDAILTHLMRE